MDETRSPQPEGAESGGSGAEPDGTPEPGAAARPAEPVVVAVTRSGGFAGLTREWTAEPAPEDAPVWVDLIERCPWDDPLDRDPAGADRFVWSIHATCGDAAERAADLPDRALTGPWRALVDAVRDWHESVDRA